MKRSLYRLPYLVLLALLLVSARSLHAQTDAGHDQVTPIGCGTLSITDEDIRQAEINTRIHAPEVYRRAQLEARTGRKGTATISSDFDLTRPFYVLNSRNDPATFDLIEAGFAYDGKLVRIWVDLRDTARVTAAKIAQLAQVLDTKTASGSRDPNKGVVENNQDVYGPPPTEFLQDGKTDFLLTDIKGKLDAQGQVTLGFFSPRDQLKTSTFQYSNEMNLLYVDDNEGLQQLTRLFGIVSHEHQHLLHYGNNVASHNSQDGDGYTFYNEGASELATILNGYAFRSTAPYLANTNVDLLRYDRVDGNKQEIDYERSLTFLLYLYEQFGEGFIRNFVKVQATSITRVNSAMELSGINLSERDWRSVIKGFAVANYVQTAPAGMPMYGFRFHPAGGSTRATARKTFSGEAFDATGTVDLERYGSAFYVYNTAGPMTITPTPTIASRNTVMMVMYYKANALVGVDERPVNGSSIEVGRQLGSYDKIVLGFVSLDNERATVNFTANKLTVGVREENATSGGLSIAEISPNPAREETFVRYRSEAGALRLEIFDARGERVATPVDGASSTRGDHQIRLETSTLAPGMYVLRLTQAGRIVTRPLIVVR